MINEEKIYHIIRDLIFRAKLPPGQQLKETSLAEAFNVSRTPIRAVLQRLKFDSLVEIIPKKGAFVYCPNPREAEQIFYVRHILEPEAAGLAAVRATPKQIEWMERLLKEEYTLYQKGEIHQALLKTQQLHMTIIEASRNPYLIEPLRKLVSLSHIILAYYNMSGGSESHAEDEHSAIINAIRDGNVSLAKELSALHTLSIKRDIDFSRDYRSLASLHQVISRYLA
ncbi:FCD domain-containing protein [Terrilactibacillus sp. BCM23-1]|uniref:FCD domain-containing protein n=1 Tax=Terrilactibacillus tamarindi TaxID=2599694 RepID=A0A6N8CMC4_9BACI|nr:GntR family transcriptional regulator [Terrilactibacillus tamarindi]MTT31179.1 FCD domain-containing protein [Terrilactibacillus tamarindi]